MTVTKIAMRYPMGPHLAGDWKLWQWMDIPSVDNPHFVYLRRLRVVQTPWFSVLVHWIYETDEDRFFHDHPWTWFYSWVLRGGYREVFFPDKDHFYKLKIPPLENHFGRWSIHKMHMRSAHRVVALTATPTMTLVVTGRRVRKFRFWLPEGPTEYDKVRGLARDDAT